jgi:tetratricopeptide (TPR) repeat protein
MRGFAPISFILFLMLFIFSISKAASPETLFGQANQLFLKGDYKNAAASYEEILHSNKMVSPELYYNLGNCYYKLTDFPNAILNYERALKLEPGDEDVLFNLRLANQKIEDRIEAVPELFYYRWYNWLHTRLPAGAWGLIFLVFMSFAAAGFYMYVLSASIGLKKTGFYGALVSLIVGIGVFSLAWSRYQSTYKRKEAIIFSGSVSVKSAPTETSTGLFLLHAGSKVKATDQLEGWVKIKTHDGNEGWILQDDLEFI